MQFPEFDPSAPVITQALPTEDGYFARQFCVVDGFPAEITMNVQTHRWRYSQYSISIWDATNLEWRSVWTLHGEDVGQMSSLRDSEETIAKLNSIATLLWNSANVIVTQGRTRAEQLDRVHANDLRNDKAFLTPPPSGPTFLDISDAALERIMAAVRPARADGQSDYSVTNPAPGFGPLLDYVEKGIAADKGRVTVAEPDLSDVDAPSNVLDDSDLAALRAKLAGEA